jgi:hypothetical protein
LLKPRPPFMFRKKVAVCRMLPGVLSQNISRDLVTTISCERAKRAQQRG